jgi:hypothetical protein
MCMNRKTGNGFVWWCASGLCLLLLAGCGPQSDRSSLEGTVTLNGEPLAEGSIALRPLPGTRGPTAGGRITNGTFAILPEQGTFAGPFAWRSPHRGRPARKQKTRCSASWSTTMNE